MPKKKAKAPSIRRRRGLSQGRGAFIFIDPKSATRRVLLFCLHEEQEVKDQGDDVGDEQEHRQSADHGTDDSDEQRHGDVTEGVEEAHARHIGERLCDAHVIRGHPAEQVIEQCSGGAIGKLSDGPGGVAGQPDALSCGVATSHVRPFKMRKRPGIAPWAQSCAANKDKSPERPKTQGLSQGCDAF